MNHTQVLCFVLGWQGGTLHQVSDTLGVPQLEILAADEHKMGELCRLAQRKNIWKHMAENVCHNVPHSPVVPVLGVNH